ncbi:cytochrome c oxidase assembly protein [Massilia sp. PAMC28688]|uniref:cytochrome c oxidase assembly protein n=1 Tax=Massilia sp. PAMC28688 TaxID=2861283 RepID=UPI001C62948A|nr:cytochrome c oxidase assembly protein [Massilia sp. PAMC28688]QYF94645.1 cytochrome c oxidase assembly protein [Massilia sp. PAMC28688]
MRVLKPTFLFRCGALALLPAQAFAHGGEHDSWWTLDPWIITPMSLLGLLYLGGLLWLRRRQHAGVSVQPLALASAATGGLTLFFSLIWPLDAFSESSFAAHMAQHMLLIAVAGPLLALARISIPINAALAAVSPAAAAALSLPRKWLRLLLMPSLVFTLHGATIWIWHSPVLFELALRVEWIHTLEHLSFLIAGYWYWTVLMRHGEHEGNASASLSLLSTLMHTGLLGALITFAPHPLYSPYIATQGSIEQALQDQQLAGLLMWIPVGAVYLIGGLAFIAAWLRSAERRPQHR